MEQENTSSTKSIKKRNTVLLASLVIIVLFSSVFVAGNILTSKAGLQNHMITLTEEGFVPDSLVIKKGESITFKTTTGKIFWPASDPHPIHTGYPEFDPGDPIDPSETWVFTFRESGTWKFHDHLSPYFTGIITVK